MTNRLICTAAVFAALAAAPALAQETPADLACGVETVTIYFAPGKSDLSAPARDLIESFAELRRGCSVAGLTATAAASDAETAEERDRLSEARSRAVVAALGERGIHAPVRLAEAQGDGEASVMPVSRSVNVEIAFAPPSVG